MKTGQRQRLSGPLLYRAGSSEAAVLDDEERRFRFSFSSETPYERRNWFDGAWVEILGHKADEIDLDVLNAGGAAILWGHNRRERAEHVGVIERAWIENSRGMAEGRLSKRADLDDLWRDIKDGIVANTSAGYQIKERTLVKENHDAPDEYRVTSWVPKEVSLVPVPADATVGVGRSDDAGDEYEITDLPFEDEEKSMKKAAEPAKPEEGAAPGAATQEPAPTVRSDTPPATDPKAIQEAQERGAADERKRVADINELCTKAGLDSEFANELIEKGTSVDEARSLAIDKIAEGGPAPRQPSLEIVKEAGEKTREAAEEWLLSRAGLVEDGKRVVAAGDNPCRGMKLLDLARDCLQRSGENVSGLFGHELATRAIAHSTSDFTVILENTMHKMLLDGFNVASDTWRAFCATGDLSDFRPHNRYLTGSFSDLKEVNENGEFEDGTLDDGRKETITAKTMGRILNLSREMIVNDDMGVFTGASRQMGRAAARTLENDVYALLALNSDMGPTMSDANSLFHADHGNVGTGAPSVDNVAAAINILRSQTLPNSSSEATEYLDPQNPPIFLGPLGLAQDAKVINEAQYDPDTSNKLQKPNKARGLISLVVGTPRRTGTPWFLFSDPNEIPVIEVGFLDGVQEPQLMMRESFRQDGISWRVVYYYGVAAVNWLGCFRSTGS